MYVIHAQFHTIGLKVYEQIILNLGAVPAVRYANIYLSFIKSPSWVLDGLCNCTLSEDEGLKITEGKRLMATRAELKKAETNCHVCGKSLPGGSVTCQFTQGVRNSILPLFRLLRGERAKDQTDLTARNSCSIKGLL